MKEIIDKINEFSRLARKRELTEEEKGRDKNIGKCTWKSLRSR